MIYLDANAGIPLRPQSKEAIEEALLKKDIRGNPSSIHTAGRNAASALREARESVAEFLFAEAEYRERMDFELVFTSSASESISMAVRGFWGDRVEGRIVSSAFEHPAMLSNLEALEGQLVLMRPRVGELVIDEKSFCEEVLSEPTALVSLMAANNETGALQPVIEVARRLRAARYYGPIVCDITQALWKSDLDCRQLFLSGVNALCFSGYKLGAPAGVGVLVFSTCNAGGSGAEFCLSFSPQLLGGAQQGGYRAGAENMLGAISLGAVCRHLRKEAPFEREKMGVLRGRLLEYLKASACEVEFILPPSDKSCTNTLLVRFLGIRADDMLVGLDLAGVMASAGAACASGKQGESHVLEAIGLGAEAQRECIRFSLSWNNTEREMEAAAQIIEKVYLRMRGLRVSYLGKEAVNV